MKKRGAKSNAVVTKKTKETGNMSRSTEKKVNNGKTKKAASSGKKRKREDSDDEVDEGEGFEVVGKIVPAPTSGRGEWPINRYV